MRNDDGIRERLAAAEAALTALQREVRELRALVDRPAPAAQPPVRVGGPVDGVWGRRDVPPAPAPPPRAQPPRAPEPPRAPAPVLRTAAPAPRTPEPVARPAEREPSLFDREIDLSDLVGPKAFAIAGGIVTLLGVVFFFVLAANRGWIGPELRVTLGAAASAAVFGGGFWLRRRDAESYASLAAVGAGIAGGYVTLAASTILYGLLPAALALPIAATIAAAGVAVALTWSSQLVAALGLLGAIAAPALLALDEGISGAGTGFVAIVLAAAIVVALREGWPELLVASAAAGIAQAVWLVLATGELDWDVVAVSAIFAALLLATGVAYELRADLPHPTLPVSFVLASAGFAAFAARMLFDGDNLGVVLAVVAVVYGVVAAALFVRGDVVDLSSLAGAVALTFAAVAAAELLSGQSLAIAWSAQAAVLAWLARAIDEPRYQLGALAYLGLAVGHVLAIDAPATDLFQAREHPAAGVPSVLALALAQVVFAWFAQAWEGGERLRLLAALDMAVRGAQETLRLASAFIAALLGVYALSLGIMEAAQLFASSANLEVEAAFEWGHVAVTATAALAALLAMVVATRVGRSTLRAGVLVGLAIVLVKALFLDIDQLDAARSGWSALAVAAVVFAVSLLARHASTTAAEADAFALTGLTIAASFGAYAPFALLEGSWEGVDLEGLGLLALALPYAAGGALELRPRRDLGSGLIVLALVIAGAASVFLLADAWLVLAWAIAATVLAALPHVTGEPRFLLASHAYAALALAYTMTPIDDRGFAALALAVGLLVTGVLIQHVSTISRELDPIAVVEAVASALLGGYAVYELLVGSTAEGFGLLAVAAPFAVVGAFELARRRDYASVQFALAVIALGAAAVLLFDGTWLVLAWAALAVGLSAVTIVSSESRFLVAVHAFAGLAVAHTLVVEAPPGDLFVAAAGAGDGVPALLLAAGAVLAAALVAAREDRFVSVDERPLPVALRDALPTIREVGLWLAGTLGIFALSLTLLQAALWISTAGIDTDFQRGHSAVSASWGIVGLLLLYCGLRYELTRLRVAGLVLFGISLAKLFLYDLAFLSSITRALSFLAVGALLLLAGFFYQRLVRPDGSALA